MSKILNSSFLLFCVIHASAMQAETPDCAAGRSVNDARDMRDFSGTMVQIPAGTFTQGQSGVAEPEHEVTLTRDYFLSETEITNQQYIDALQWAYDNGMVIVLDNAVYAHGRQIIEMNWNSDFSYQSGSFVLVPSSNDWGDFGPGEAFPDGYDPANHGAAYVSWYGAACFCDWLSIMEGYEPYYDGNWDIANDLDPYGYFGYRLPTEAEWEYAGRYPDQRSYPWGNQSPICSLSNFHPSVYCTGWTGPVGIRPNGDSELGLKDMAGNVGEWVNDWHESYTSEAVVDPIGPASGTTRVIKGGAWTSNSVGIRCADRSNTTPEQTDAYWGFRMCFSLGIDVAVEEPSRELPTGVQLGEAYPNPFNPLTTIPFELSTAGDVRLAVFDLAGQEVALLHDGPAGQGPHQLQFDGSALASGMYLLRLEAGGECDMKKLLLVK